MVDSNDWFRKDEPSVPGGAPPRPVTSTQPATPAPESGTKETITLDNPTSIFGGLGSFVASRSR